MLKRGIVGRHNAGAFNFLAHGSFYARVDAERHLTIAFVHILCLVLETIELADGGGNFFTVDVRIGLGISGSQELGLAVLLVPGHLAVVSDKPHLNLISGESVIVVVGLRPREVHVVALGQLDVLVSHGRLVNGKCGRRLDDRVGVPVLVTGREHRKNAHKHHRQ